MRDDGDGDLGPRLLGDLEEPTHAGAGAAEEGDRTLALQQFRAVATEAGARSRHRGEGIGLVRQGGDQQAHRGGPIRRSCELHGAARGCRAKGSPPYPARGPPPAPTLRAVVVTPQLPGLRLRRHARHHPLETRKIVPIHSGMGMRRR